MRVVVEALKQRVCDIARAVPTRKLGSDGHKMTRWAGDLDPSQVDLDSFKEHRDGTLYLRYRRRGNRLAGMAFDHVTPYRIRDLELGEPVTLDAEVIDSASITIRNLSDVPQEPVNYESFFGSALSKTVSEEESFTHGIEESVRNTFTGGNDATPVKNETEVGFAAHQEWAKKTGQSDTDEKSKARTVAVPARAGTQRGLRVEVERALARMERLATGRGDVEHSVRIGLYDDGWWGDREWDSFRSMLHAMRGDAGDNRELGRYFREHPVAARKLAALEAPLDLPFKKLCTYDDVTRLDVTYTPLGI